MSDAATLVAEQNYATAASPPAGSERLALAGLDFAFEADAPKVLSSVDLAVHAGDRILLLGPSGGGKSTLLMVLAGLIPRIVGGALSGTVRLDGIDTTRVETSLAAFSSAVAIVMQDPESQITCLTVEDEIAFALENFNLPQAEINARTDGVLARCGMEAMRHALVYTLSGGQKQRLAIACALARQPEVLILDEPLSNLDPAGCAEVMPLIAETAGRAGSAMVMTAHDFAGFASLFTRVVIVAEGRVLRDGPIRAVLCDVPLLAALGLEVPLFLQWAHAMLGPAMTAAPLSLDEALERVRRAGIRASLPPAFGTARPAQAAGEALVEVSGLSVAFGRRAVLRDLDFAIRKHDFLALVGFNGSGKSTLALTLAGAIAPSRGGIRLAGTPYRYRRGRQIGQRAVTPIGYVFQYPEHQFLHETAAAELRHGRPDLPAEEIARLLGEIGIANPVCHPYELSGGEKRRLGVRSTVLLAPALLILDEPTYGQDERNRALIEADLRALHQDGTTIVVITHDMDLIYRLASRVMVLREGMIVADASVEDFFGDNTDLAGLGLAEPPLRALQRAVAEGS